MNMLRPSMASIIRQGDNCYSFVVGVAKRARQIAEIDEEEHISDDEKPVKRAIEEFACGKYRIGYSGMKEE